MFIQVARDIQRAPTICCFLVLTYILGMIVIRVAAWKGNTIRPEMIAVELTSLKLVGLVELAPAFVAADPYAI
eukprot:5247313-Amphidinium_carterae.1